MGLLRFQVRTLVASALLATVVVLVPSFAEAGMKTILPSEMVPRKSLTDFIATPSFLSLSEVAAVVAGFSAPVQLPVGSTITKVTLFFRGSGTDQTWLYLRRVRLAAGSPDDQASALAQAINLTDSTGDVVAVDLTFESGAGRKVQRGWTYYLYLQLQGSSTFSGAKIYYK